VIKQRAVFCQVSRLPLRGTMPKLRRSTKGGIQSKQSPSGLEAEASVPDVFLCQAPFVRLYLFADICLAGRKPRDILDHTRLRLQPR
jgi:hypothetical protein